MSSLKLASRKLLGLGLNNVVKSCYGATDYLQTLNLELPRWFSTLGRVRACSLNLKPTGLCFRSNFPQVLLSTCPKPQSEIKYTVTFVKANGDRVTAKGKEGDSLLDVVVNNNLDFDGFGACEGTLTCSTCHCIFKQEDYDKLPEQPSDEELDMLDLAYDLTDTSRLGCQIQLTKELDGLEVKIPATINDARS